MPDFEGSFSPLSGKPLKLSLSLKSGHRALHLFSIPLSPADSAPRACVHIRVRFDATGSLGHDERSRCSVPRRFVVGSSNLPPPYCASNSFRFALLPFLWSPIDSRSLSRPSPFPTNSWFANSPLAQRDSRCELSPRRSPFPLALHLRPPTRVTHSLSQVPAPQRSLHNPQLACTPRLRCAYCDRITFTSSRSPRRPIKMWPTRAHSPCSSAVLFRLLFARDFFVRTKPGPDNFLRLFSLILRIATDAFPVFALPLGSGYRPCCATLSIFY